MEARALGDDAIHHRLRHTVVSDAEERDVVACGTHVRRRPLDRPLLARDDRCEINDGKTFVARVRRSRMACNRHVRFSGNPSRVV